MTDGVRDLADEVNAKRDEILEIAARHGASNVRILGSVARNEARHDSDVDVLVDLEPGRTRLDHAALMIELKELLNCKVDVATERGLKARIRDRVLAEAVLL
jgi:predicted nucleotidyltransferase